MNEFIAYERQIITTLQLKEEEFQEEHLEDWNKFKKLSQKRRTYLMQKCTQTFPSI